MVVVAAGNVDTAMVVVRIAVLELLEEQAGRDGVHSRPILGGAGQNTTFWLNLNLIGNSKN